MDAQEETQPGFNVFMVYIISLSIMAIPTVRFYTEHRRNIELSENVELMIKNQGTLHNE